MLQMVFDYVKRHRWRYLLVAVSLMIYDVSLVVPTKLVEAFVDQMSRGLLTEASLVRLVLALVGVTLLSYTTAYIWYNCLFRGSRIFLFELRVSTFEKLLSMRRPFYDKFRSGDMVTRFSSDAESLQELVGYGLMVVLYAGGMFAFIIPMMVSISWLISLLGLLPIVVMVIIIYGMGRKQDQLVDENRDAVASLNNEVLETIEGIRVSRAYQTATEQEQIFQEKTERLAELGNRITRYQASYPVLTLFFLGVSTVLVLWFGAKSLALGHLSLAQVLALQLYLVSLVEPFVMLSDLVLVYQTGRTAFGKIQELARTSDDLEADGQLLLDKFEELEVTDYYFRYPQASRESLAGLNFVLKAGQTLGLVGKTGSGKTSLVRQLLRQYPLGQGEFLVNGRPITDYARSSLAQQVAYVPQEHVLFSKSVADNVRLGRPDASQEELLTAIGLAAFFEDLSRLSDGLETKVGERGVSISGGQKQRLSLARAFLREADILILDDSLSAVDAKTEQEIIRNIKTNRSGKTTIIVSHRLSAVHDADQVLVLDEGRIVERGTPAQLLAQGGWYAQQYHHQNLKGKEA